MVEKLNYWESGERGKELKVPHHASAAAARDSNLPQLAPNNGHLPLFPTFFFRGLVRAYPILRVLISFCT